MIKIRKLKKEDIPQMINLYAEFLRDQYGRNKYYEGDYSFKRGSEYWERIVRLSDILKAFLCPKDTGRRDMPRSCCRNVKNGRKKKTVNI